MKEPTTLDELYRMYHSYVYEICRSNIESSPEWTDELESNVWFKVVKNWAKFNWQSMFKTWVTRIAINESINLREKIRTHKRREREYAKLGYRNHSAFYDLGTPETQIMAEQQAQEIRNIFKYGRSGDNDVGREIIINQSKYEQCQRKLGIKLGTVRSRLNKFRGRLNQLDFEQPSYPMNIPYKSKYTIHDYDEIHKENYCV